ncbi:serine-protein kinase ATM-like [Physella acuta]|uniref:serine-protein kinase ATM-like n=1 Tax=Physella acuta TaxID=109671 RepID=UPI0027DD8E41|nr:serine-protein kinase ATM-like [Physella acuta]
MESSLYDVHNCLRGLESSKVTERKKSATQLEQLFGTSSVLRSLDEISQSTRGDGKTITWNVILKAVNKYVDLEITALQTAKESQSAATLNNRDKKKQELAALFRLVIRTANSRGPPKIRLDLIIESILNILNDTYTLNAFGAEYSNVLLKSVLRVRQYWLEISAEQWKKLLQVYCRLYDDKQFDPVILARIIQELMQGYVLQGEQPPRKMFSFFTKVLKHIRELKSPSIVESMLSALNTFSQAAALNSRAQLCYFGESLMPSFIYLWGSPSTDKVKEEVLDFLLLLVHVHHPNGAPDQSVGAYADNWEQWKTQVATLHEMIHTDLEGRYKFTTGTKVITLKPNYIQLAVGVFKQMPESKLLPADTTMLFTQASQQSSHGDCGALPAKRMRLSVENKSLLEVLKEKSNTLQAIPWLQILHGILDKYPECFGKEGLKHVLYVVASLLRECKRGQLYQFVFDVLTSLIQAIQSHDAMDKQTAQTLSLVWSTCVSTINSKQAEVEGYQENCYSTMAAIIMSGGITPMKEIWNLFLPNYRSPSTAANELLVSLITSHSLLENYMPSVVGAAHQRTDKSLFPLREALLEWLLPIPNFEITGLTKIATSPVRVGEILFALTLLDPCSVLKNCPLKTSNDRDPNCMETVFLKTTFDLNMASMQQSSSSNKPAQSGATLTNPHVSAILDFLIKHLEKIIECLDFQTPVIEYLSWLACLLGRLVCHVEEKHPARPALQLKFQKVMEKCTAALAVQIRKESVGSLVKSLGWLVVMVTWESQAGVKLYRLFEIIRCYLPPSFIDLLLDVSSGKLIAEKKRERKPEGSKQSSKPHKLFSNGEHSHREEDLDFDDFNPVNTSRAGHDSDLDMDIDFGADHTEETHPVKDVWSFLSEENLTEPHQLRLLSTELLCKSIAFDRRLLGENESQLSCRAEMDSDHIKGRLLYLIGSHCFDPNAAINIHQLMLITKYLMTKVHVITPANIKSILSVFKQTAKVLSSDCQVCCAIVTHLGYIIPHLSCPGNLPSEELKFCRDYFFKFISDFWQLASEGSPQLKFELAKVMSDVIKLDPDHTWGQLKVMKEDEDDDDNGTELITMGQQLPKLLAEENILVRYLAADSIKWLFVTQAEDKTCIMREKSSQLKAFQAIFLQCSDYLDVEPGKISQHPGKISQHVLKDELSNRQATCLAALLTIITHSPVCERQCLLGLVQMLGDNKITLVLVRKMLNIISRELQYKDIQSYLHYHLPYIIHNWQNKSMVNSSIKHFPFQLFCYDTAEQFIRSNQDLIVSEVLITKLTMAEVRAVLDPLNIDPRQAVVSSLPRLLVHILPLFANPPQPLSPLHSQFVRANSCFKILKDELTEEKINECVADKLGEVVMGILRSLHIEREKSNPTHCMVYPEPNPPFYNKDMIKITLNYLAQNFTKGGNNTTLVSVLIKVQDGLYQVLLSLATMLGCEHRTHEQIRLLLMYGLFVDMLLDELENGLGGAWASVVRDVINRLLTMLRVSSDLPHVTSPSFEEECILACLHILNRVCKKALVICPDEMANYVHCIVDIVAYVAVKTTAISQLAREIILSVISNHGESDDLKNSLAILNPVSPSSCMQDVNLKIENLHQTREHTLINNFQEFLNVCQLMSGVPTDGLALRLHQLAAQVIQHHKEVDNMAATPHGLNCLKKVVLELVRLLTSPSQQMSGAAASCLGAIGPVDLQSLSLPQQLCVSSQATALELYKGHEFEKYCWLFHTLDSYLLDDNIEVVKTAGNILKDVMATKSGHQFETHYSELLKEKSFLFYYLHPFKSSGKLPNNVKEKREAVNYLSPVDEVGLWCGDVNSTHEQWIIRLTITLLQTDLVCDEIMNKVGPMCALKSKFCEDCLPYLIHDLLQNGGLESRKIMSAHFTSFFHGFTKHVSSPSGPHLAYTRKESVRAMLNVVQYLRKQDRPKEKGETQQNAWTNNFWLEIDYLDVARAALYCGANFSAVLFAEIWLDSKLKNKGENSPSSSGSSSQDSPLDPLAVLSSQVDLGQGHELQGLLLEAYRNIGDPDGIYGCGAGRLAEPMARVETYLHELEPTKALTSLDIEISNNSSQSYIPLLKSLELCGSDYILQHCLSGLNDENMGGSSASPETCQKLKDYQFHMAWKLGQWDSNLPAKQNESATFNQSLYQALSSLHDGHLDVAKNTLGIARLNVIKRFDPQVENCQSLYPFLSDLQCLSHLEQILSTSEQAGSWISLYTDVTSALITTKPVDFMFEQPLLHLLATVGKILAKQKIKQGDTLETSALWSLAVSGRKSKRFQLAERAIRELKTKDLNRTASLINQDQLQVEEAKLFWARSEPKIAINIMKNLISKLGQAYSTHTSSDISVYPEALGIYGNWLAETKLETPAVIITEYLEKTVTLMLKAKMAATSYDKKALNAFVSLARFADCQYQQVADYMRSPTFQEKRNLLQRTKKELEECREFREELKKSKYLNQVERNFKIDQQEITSLGEDRNRFLHQAIENYLRCLEYGDIHDLTVFRVVALWFENSSNDLVNHLIQSSIKAIKTYKFLPLYYQLAARMNSTDSTKFQQALMRLMQKVAEDHPHHALWIIMALANAHKDDELLTKETASKRRSKLTTPEAEISDVARVQAAKDLLVKLSQSNKKLGSIIQNMEQLCVAYIELANWPVASKKGPQPLLPTLQILKLDKLDNVLLPSVELDVDPSGAYTSLVSPVRFDKKYETVGGINLPKVIKCLGSDGHLRTQLVKGQDDLRQDAVMQQVFSLVNQLLAGAPETRQRQLNIRTYKVIPLSQKCGLLQWCEGTQPLGEYLIGTTRSPGAHTMYRPKDWLPRDCRNHLHNSGNEPDKRFKAYQEICANFKPVFRYFFMENFMEPSTWFEKRLIYTRSVATTSIVGYILGLGDRHLMNILIDKQTAELVHIDLGIAFDMGHILPTPETVPFRLTRDIVDGMGVTGVEGVFRRCCEQTMHVMKTNSESLMTIVQVLLHDPLSHWTLTPQQALTIQRKREQANQDIMEQSMAASFQVPSSGQIPASGQPPATLGLAGGDLGTKASDSKDQNKLAERTLLRLKQKLNGQEGNAQLSVSGQVNFLIQMASDPRNLCKLFAGWQPYL